MSGRELPGRMLLGAPPENGKGLHRVTKDLLQGNLSLPVSTGCRRKGDREASPEESRPDFGLSVIIPF